VLKLKGKKAVITGASSGIGLGIARQFAGEGAQVIVHYNSNREGADQAVAAIREKGSEAWAIQAEVSSQTDIDRLVGKARDLLGNIDIWMNNAGADILTGANAGMDDSVKLQRLVNVDLVGTMYCCWSVLPLMQAQGSGVIINMSWDLALHGFNGRNPQMFAAVKAGITGFSKSLALTCAPEVRVNVIAPGWIETAFAEQSMDRDYYRARTGEIPLGRFGRAEDVARAAVYLASDDAAYITGQVLNVNGGLV